MDKKPQLPIPKKNEWEKMVELLLGGEKPGRTDPAMGMSLSHLESEGICLQDFSFLLFHTGCSGWREIVPQRDREHWLQHKNFCPYMTTELYEVQ